MKRILLISALLWLSQAGSVFASSPYKDVPSNHWANESLNKCIDAGFISGHRDIKFKGETNLNRYQTAVIVNKLMNKVGYSRPLSEAEQRELATSVRNLSNRMKQIMKDLLALKLRVHSLEKSVRHFAERRKGAIPVR